MGKNILENLDMSELGKKLQQARINRGLTQEEAAKIINVARTTITAIEKGERRIRAEELVKLSNAYGKEIYEFTRPEIKVEMSQPQFRGPTLRTDADNEQIQPYVETLKKLSINYFDLERIMANPLIRKYPHEYNIEGLKITDAAETVAIEERNRLGLGDGPITTILRDMLEQDVGIRIFYYPIQTHKFSAIYLYDKEIGGCIAVNANHPEERRRWSLAHDYGHFLVHRQNPLVYIDDQHKHKSGSERFADDFALYFLMPTSGLKRRANDIMRQSKKGITIADLCTLAAYYGVSVAAMADRLEGLDLLPTGTWDWLQREGFKVRAAQQKLGLTPIPSRDDKLPIRYQHLALSAFEEGKITESRFASFLEVDRLEARYIAESLRQEGDVGYDINTNLNNTAGIQEEQ